MDLKIEANDQMVDFAQSENESKIPSKSLPNPAHALSAKSLRLESLKYGHFNPQSWQKLIGRRVIVRDQALPTTADDPLGEMMWHGFVISVDWSDLKIPESENTQEVPAHKMEVDSEPQQFAPTVATSNKAKSAKLIVQFVSGDIEAYDVETNVEIWLLPKKFPGFDELIDPQCLGKFDFCVVGAGAAGLSAAREILKISPGSTLGIFDAKDDLGGVAGFNVKVHGMLDDDPTRVYAYRESSKCDSGFAINSHQPVDYSLVFWAREVFHLAILSALVSPAKKTNKFPDFASLFDACLFEWLHKIEAGHIEDSEIVGNFKLPNERQQVIAIFDYLKKETFGSQATIEESLLMELVKSRFQKGDAVELQILKTTASGKDVLRVASQVCGIFNDSYLDNFLAAVNDTKSMEEISRFISGLDGVIDGRSEAEKLEDAEIESATFAVIQEWLDLSKKVSIKAKQTVDESAGLNEADDISDLVDDIRKFELSGEVGVYGGSTVVSIESSENKDYVKIWIRRKGLKYIICNHVVLGVAISSLLQKSSLSLEVMDPEFTQFSNLLFTLFDEKTDERMLMFHFKEGHLPWEGLKFPADWRSHDIRGWHELSSLVILFSDTDVPPLVKSHFARTPKKIAFGSGMKFTIFDEEKSLVVRVPFNMPVLNVKREVRNALVNMFPVSKIPDPVVLETAPTLSFKKGANLSLHPASPPKFLNDMMAVCGDYTAPDIELLGSIRGASRSGLRAAQSLLSQVHASQPNSKSASKSLKSKNIVVHDEDDVMLDRLASREEVSDNFLVGFADTFIGRKVEPNEITTAIVEQEGAYEDTLEKFDLTGFNKKDLLRCIVLEGNGYRYRKDSAHGKVYFPRRRTLNAALKDRQVTEAVMRTGSPDIFRQFCDNIKEARRSVTDPYAIALQIMKDKPLELPSLDLLVRGPSLPGTTRPEVIRSRGPDAEWSDDPSTASEKECMEETTRVAVEERLNASSGSKTYRCSVNVGGLGVSRTPVWLNSRRTRPHAIRDHSACTKALQYIDQPEQKRQFVDAWKNMTWAGGRPFIPHEIPAEERRQIRRIAKRVMKEYLGRNAPRTKHE